MTRVEKRGIVEGEGLVRLICCRAASKGIPRNARRRGAAGKWDDRNRRRTVRDLGATKVDTAQNLGCCILRAKGRTNEMDRRLSTANLQRRGERGPIVKRDERAEVEVGVLVVLVIPQLNWTAEKGRANEGNDDAVIV